MNEQQGTSSRDGYTPRDLLMTTAFLHIMALVFWPISIMTFIYGFAVLSVRPLAAMPYLLPPLAIVAVFIWAWRRQRWLPAVAFLVVTVAFWFCIISPWLHFNQ